MSTSVSSIEIPRNVNVKAIALPIEHGSWGFLFEPLIAGLLVAFSPAAIWISILLIGMFLTRQPLKILISSWQEKRKLPQTEVALKFALIYSAIFMIGALGTFFSVSTASLLPFAIFIPFGIYQVYCDVSRSSRQLIPELTGAIAISSSVSVIALADGWTFSSSMAIWFIFIARLISSILYVRNRLRLEKGKFFSHASPIISHLIALIAIASLSFNGLIPFLPLAAFAILLVRAIIGLSPYRRRVKAIKIGIWEVMYGLIVVFSTAIGWNFGI